MATPKQKADVRPISFILHNMAENRSPVEVPLVIRPEDLTRPDVSRLSTTQTLGGAWADNFGPGIPTVQISGHTGWGAGGRPDGFEEFVKLHRTIFKEWHALRDSVLRSGRDPDLVKLIFADKLDDFVWVVAPQNFVLKRNKSRPLLSQYQISLTYLSADVADTLDALEEAKKAAAEDAGLTDELGIESLAKSIENIAAAIKNKISAFLGPIKAVFDNICTLTARVLGAVQRIIKAGMGVISAVSSGLIGIATSIARAAANVTNIVRSITSLPMKIKAEFQRVAMAFENAFCVLSNVFKRRRFLPNFNDLYGASLCSSTAGGSPMSKYDTANPFPVLLPVDSPALKVSSSASAAINRMAGTDPVLSPLSVSQLQADAPAANNGVEVTV